MLHRKDEKKGNTSPVARLHMRKMKNIKRGLGFRV